MDTGMLFQILGAQIVLFFLFYASQSLVLWCPGCECARSTKDDDLVCKISRVAGRDSFVKDAAGFEDGAGWQGATMEFHQDGEM